MHASSCLPANQDLIHGVPSVGDRLIGDQSIVARTVCWHVVA